mgnify:CR=1 FL=1
MKQATNDTFFGPMTTTGERIERHRKSDGLQVGVWGRAMLYIDIPFASAAMSATLDSSGHLTVHDFDVPTFRALASVCAQAADALELEASK